MEKREKIWEGFKTAIIAVLLVALICLCVIYMLSFQGKPTPAFTKSVLEAIGAESAVYRYNGYLSNSYVCPKYLCFSSKNAGDPFVLTGESEKTLAAYSSVAPFLEKLFGSQGTVTYLDAQTGKAAFESAMNGDYIYIAYSCDLPKSVIWSMAFKNTAPDPVSGEFLREIFILPERFIKEGPVMTPDGILTYTRAYSFCAIARDSAGNYYRYTTGYTPEDTYALCFNSTYYMTYKSASEARPYTFAAMKEGDEFLVRYGFFEKLTDTSLLLGADKQMPMISMRPGDLSETACRALLEAFFMNPQQVSSYTDAAGNRYYLDEGQNVQISPDGTVEYQALGEGGIALSNLFDYHGENETYGTVDYIGAALLLVESLDPVRRMHEIEGMNLVLSSVSYDGWMLTLRFGYTYRGIPILKDGSADMFSVSLADGFVKAFTCRLTEFQPVENSEETVPDMLLSLRRYLLDTAGVQEEIFWMGRGYLFDRETEISRVCLIRGY